MRIALIVLIIFALVSPAVAEMSGKEFKEQMRDKTKAPQMELYLMGIYVGIGWVNSLLKHDSRKPYYCTNLTVSSKANVAILDKYIIQHPDEEELPVGLLLLKAYMDKFPCKN